MSPINVETGPMFSGKSAELTEIINRRLIGEQQPGKDFLAFNHYKDNRYGESIIGAHNGKKVEALPLKNSHQLVEIIFQDLPKDPQQATLENIKPQYRKLRAIYIDEGQFFDKDLAVVLDFIDDIFAQRPPEQPSIDIRVAGLDTDFRGEPFPGPMPDIIAQADHVEKHKAVCTHKDCGNLNATRTQRLVNGRPANYTDPTVVVGAKENYTARCKKHHQVPGKSKLSFKENPASSSSEKDV